MSKFIYLVFLVLYCGFIFWLSSRPSVPVQMLFPNQDKLFHMGAYFILAILASGFFNECFSKPTTVIIASLCYCSLYGVSDEWHQSFVPGRVADFSDWLADTLGASIALTILHLTQKRTVIGK